VEEVPVLPDVELAETSVASAEEAAVEADAEAEIVMLISELRPEPLRASMDDERK
jgi:hypothetical protein